MIVGEGIAGAPGGSFGGGGDGDNDTRSGTDLGLALFGTSQLYKNQVEEEFNAKLEKVEHELEDIQNGLGLLDTGDDGEGRLMARGPSNDDSYSEEEEEDDDDDLDAHDIPKLQAHISFLQQCSRARKLLDDVDSLSLSTNFATSSWDNNGARGEGTPRNNVGGSSVTFPYSPSSLCSPTDFMKFTFDSVSSASKGGGEGGSPFVRAAKLIKESEELLHGVMLDSKGQQGDKENANNVVEDNDASAQTTRMQAEMLNELRTQTRRKKMELRHRAVTLAEGCVSVEENRLLVRGSGTSVDRKSVAFDAGASPISASTPSNNNSDAASEIPPSPLSDAYQVLELFTNANFPSFGETLDGTMKKLSEKLFQGVLQPCLNEVLYSNDKSSKEGGVGYYKFAQESLKRVRSAGSGGGDRRYDPVSIKGPAVQLEWTLSSVSLNDVEKDDSMAKDANTLSATTATAEKINETVLQSTASSLTPSLASNLSSLNFLSNFLAFVHEHVLLRRSDLSSMLGQHLFGTYPPLPSDSMNETSAILGGGVLVGAAAHGIREGEEQPLMTLMVDAMRKLCIPNESSPEVWRVLRKVEETLIVEVGLFERKLVGMDLMSDAASSIKAGAVGVLQGNRSAAVTASSPTGLSVLLSKENSGVVDSPIHPNATLSNLSSLDTSFPTAGNKENQTKSVAIISPLSQLAHNLRQAYEESRRSSILNLGRTILLNSDYHDTVQEGTFVPDLSEAGTLASLDDDLLKSTFAFHKCSISKVAKQILDLCRKTLDDSADDYFSGNDDDDEEGLDVVEHIDSLCPMLYRAARELLDLFRAIVPTLYASEVGSIPRTAAVLHNDCVFLAHESLLLGEC